jgi:bifunctional DNA-binding transcriptional regulator/antitoxin component of YhaV-PrlF toxin-antitoxin module
MLKKTASRHVPSEPGSTEKDDVTGGMVKVQKSSKGRYHVTLPKEWAEERGLEPGERLYIGDPTDGSDSTGILERFSRMFRR